MRTAVLPLGKAGSTDVIGELYGSLKMDEPVDVYIERIRGR